MGEETIFSEALGKPSPEERRAYLDGACGDDAALRAAVEALLAAHERPRGMLDTLPPTVEGFEVRGVGAGSMIGPYKLLERIGEGGMGAVWMAEQTHPVRRRVALKVIKPGMDSAAVIARFEAERQALALMDHPNIAKVLDAGTTEGGLPYFVMELVKGVPLTEYCDLNKLPPRARLELFVLVCQAVQHAHQKGIIHRDLKPGNVLVTLHDGRPVPKVIDFGVAKAVGGERLTERTLFTSFSQMVGTPLYMSPEQAEMSGLDVDTRSDVYSLGVLLYELLTGTTPFDKARLNKAAYEEIRRIIREEEPPRPSTRLSTLGGALRAVSQNRATAPEKLGRVVRGELDWIVMRALEKDRTRRYESAVGFARDVERYLKDEPIEACPPSARYKFRKFARRNRAALATGMALASVLLIASIVSLLFGLRSREDRKLAETRLEKEKQAVADANAARQAARDEAARTKREASISRAVIQFLMNDLLGKADPGKEPDPDVKVRTVLDRAADEIEGKFAGLPLVEGAVRAVLGQTYGGLGEPRLATLHLERALALHREHAGDDSPSTIRLIGLLAGNYVYLGRHEEGLKLSQEAVSLWRKNHGPGDPRTLMSMSELAEHYVEAGRHDDALRLLEEVIPKQRAVFGADAAQTLDAMEKLATAYAALRQNENAVKLLEETLAAARQALGDGHPHTLLFAHGLAGQYEVVGRPDDALRLRKEAVQICRDKYGPDHRRTLNAMNSLAMKFRRMGQHEDALKLARETLDLRRKRLGPFHPDTLLSMNNAAHACYDAERHDEALATLAEVVALRRAHYPVHSLTFDSAISLGAMYIETGHTEEARRTLEETLAALKVARPMTDPLVERVTRNLTLVYVRDVNDADLGREQRLARLADAERRLRALSHAPDAMAYADVFRDALTELREPAGPFHRAAGPAAVPGTIEAEDFDRGGPGVAYFDSTMLVPRQEKQFYRNTAVPIGRCPDGGDGFAVRLAFRGEWLTYTVDVADEGTYDVCLRLASVFGAGEAIVAVDGVEVGRIPISKTGRPAGYVTVTLKEVKLAKGQHSMRLTFVKTAVTDETDLAMVDFGRIDLCYLNWICVMTFGQDSR